MKTIIRNAQVYDGSGSPPQGPRDVAIENGIICQVGKDLDTAGADVIGADGLALMPGIIQSVMTICGPVSRAMLRPSSLLCTVATS